MFLTKIKNQNNLYIIYKFFNTFLIYNMLCILRKLLNHIFNGNKIYTYKLVVYEIVKGIGFSLTGTDSFSFSLQKEKLRRENFLFCLCDMYTTWCRETLFLKKQFFLYQAATKLAKINKRKNCMSVVEESITQSIHFPSRRVNVVVSKNIISYMT